MKINISIDLELPSFMDDFEQRDLDQMAFDQVVNRLNCHNLEWAQHWCAKMGLAPTEEKKHSYEVMMNTSNMWARIFDNSNFAVKKI